MKLKINSTRRPAGRPRSLTLENVLDAANELGLAGVSIADVASKLGVATGTVYNYVSSRDELVRLAATRRNGVAHIDDPNEQWPDLIRRHARRAFDLLVTEPQLIIQVMKGELGPHANLDYIESVLAALVARGFEPEEAFQLYKGADTIVYGAAVRATFVKAMEGESHRFADAIRQGLSEHRPDELPTIRSCSSFLDPTAVVELEEILNHLIENFAQRHEQRARSISPIGRKQAARSGKTIRKGRPARG